MKRILVAGIGNVFLRDDGFGVAVAQRLETERLPEGTRVKDFGIRAMHLAFELLEPLDLLVLVDAIARGAEPGTLCIVDPDTAPELVVRTIPDAHAMDPCAVLTSVGRMGGALPKTRIVGCEPATVEEGLGLSEPVERAIGPAIAMIRRLNDSEVPS